MAIPVWICAYHLQLTHPLPVPTFRLLDEYGWFTTSDPIQAGL